MEGKGQGTNEEGGDVGDLGAARLGDDLERELVRARLDALVDEHEQRQRAHEVQLE